MPASVWAKFFKRLLGSQVGLGMDRPGLQPGKAHPAQHSVHAALTVVSAEMTPGQLADM